MAKPRPLRRIIQDQGKLHINRRHGDVLYAAMVRVPSASPSFSCLPPDLPEHYLWLDPKDFPVNPVMDPFGDTMPVFASTRADYPGQVCALVVGPHYDTAKALAKACTFIGMNPMDAAENLVTPYLQESFSHGDVAAAMAESTRQTESTFRFDPVLPDPAEGEPVYIRYQDDSLTVDCLSPWPHLLQRLIGSCTGMPLSSIVVRSGYSPSARFGRLYDTLVPVVASSLAATTFKHSITMPFEPEDIRRYGAAQAGGLISILSCHNDEGRILALRLKLELELGAWPVATREILLQSILAAVGRYEIDALDVHVQILSAPTSPRHAGPSFGSSLTQTGLEQHWDRVASVCSQSPLEWRLMNLKHSLEGPAQLQFDDALIPMMTVLKRAAQGSDYPRRQAVYNLHARHRKATDPDNKHPREFHDGIGTAFAFQPENLTSFEQNITPSVSLILEDDGHLSIQAPIVPADLNLREIWLSYIRQELGIGERDIALSPLSSEHYVDPGPLVCGRGRTIITPLLAQACEELKTRRGEPQRPLIVTVKAPGGPLWNPVQFSGTPLRRRAWGAVVLDLRAYPSTGQIEIRKVWLNVWVGTNILREADQGLLEYQVRDQVKRCIGAGAGSDGTLSSHNWSLDVSRADYTEIHIDVHGESPATPGIIELPDTMLDPSDLPAALVPAAFLNALTLATGSIVDHFPPMAYDLSKTVLAEGSTWTYASR